MNNDGQADVIGTWVNDGVYYYDSASGTRAKLSSPARQLAAGKIGGVRDDLVWVQDNDLWVRYSRWEVAR